MKQDHIGIAVVGAGRIGTLRARLAAKHPAVRFLAVSDRDPARARALAAEAGRLCDALGLNVNVSAKTGESSIACAAAMHIAAALPQIAWGLTLTNEGLADDVTARPVRIARGHVEVSDRPGLGIDVDEERVRGYRRDVPVLRVA